MFLCRRCAHLCLERAVSQNDAAGRVTGARKIGREMARALLTKTRIQNPRIRTVFLCGLCISYSFSFRLATKSVSSDAFEGVRTNPALLPFRTSRCKFSGLHTFWRKTLLLLLVSLKTSMISVLFLKHFSFY